MVSQGWHIRLGRAVRRYVATGRLRSGPSAIIDGFFGGKECFFVQVGSNDGIRGDPLHDLIKTNPRWRGIFIEPLEAMFERLVATYRGEDRFAFEQIAISDTVDERWFYYVSQDAIRETGMPTGFDTIGSFNRAYILKSLAKMKSQPGYTFPREPEEYISSIRVRCEPLMPVLDRLKVGRIDVLAIDAETYDYQILKQLDFERFRPKLILYEHYNLTEDDRQAAAQLLAARSYRLVNCGQLDTMAVSRG